MGGWRVSRSRIDDEEQLSRERCANECEEIPPRSGGPSFVRVTEELCIRKYRYGVAPPSIANKLLASARWSPRRRAAFGGRAGGEKLAQLARPVLSLVCLSTARTAALAASDTPTEPLRAPYLPRPPVGARLAIPDPASPLSALAPRRVCHVRREPDQRVSAPVRGAEHQELAAGRRIG